MKKRFIKSLIVSFSLWYTVFATALPYTALAQEASPSPTPEATPTPEVVVTTGDAAAGSDSVGESNLFVTDVSESCPVPEECPTPTPTPEVLVSDASPSPSPESVSLEVDTTQIAESEVEASASAETGENSIPDAANAEIVTGDAAAIANSLNLANINLVGSNLFPFIETILGSQEGSINLYELLASLPQNSALPLDTTIITDQNANLTTDASASAETGENALAGDSGKIATGDAVAIANSITLANLNLVGVNSLVAIINILGSLNGDIILPNMEILGAGQMPGEVTVLTNQNASVNTDSSANSETGENNLAGAGGISTGDATAISNSTSYANLVRIGDSWGLLIINNFGNWLGSLINWGAPGESTVLPLGSQTLEKEGEAGGLSAAGNLTVITNQEAKVETIANADAGTGNNSLAGDGKIKTGNALSIANSFSLANFVGVGGGFFFGILNILGNWSGNLEMAYPDLAVSLSDGLTQNTPGATENYTIEVTNKGKAKASGVSLNFSAGADFTPSENPLINSWQLGTFLPGETRTFAVPGRLSPTALSNTQLQASAAVSSPDSESDNGNNTAGDATLVVLAEPGPKDNRTPNLEVSVWQNVNDFVFPGDTVLAAVTVTNQSPYLARNVHVKGTFANEHPMPPIPLDWDLGDLQPGEKVRIEFSIGLIEELPGGEYYLAAQAEGHAENGDAAASGWASSTFLVRLRYVINALAPEVLAESDNPGSGEILGNSANVLLDFRKLFPYILPIAILGLLLTLALRRKMEKKYGK